MTDNKISKSSKPLTMADLLASSFSKPKILNRGDEVEGEVIALTDKEIILDLGAKAEGILGKRELGSEQRENLKVGDKLKAFILSSENESGQVVLTLQTGFTLERRAEVSPRWQKFTKALHSQQQFKGRVIEVNRGGLMVEVEGTRGFLPASQIGLANLIKFGGLDKLVGEELLLSLVEVDPATNRLIFSSRGVLSQKTSEGLAKIKAGEKIVGKIAAITPTVLFVDLGDIEGVIYAQEVAWEEVESLESRFEVGQEVEAQVIDKDEKAGRVSLSLRRLQKDPFEEVAGKFAVDDVVSGTVTEVTTSGASIKLESGVEGFLPAGKMEQGVSLNIGQSLNFLVDGVDKERRKVNLAPFLISTKGLIYK